MNEMNLQMKKTLIICKWINGTYKGMEDLTNEQNELHTQLWTEWNRLTCLGKGSEV